MYRILYNRYSCHRICKNDSRLNDSKPGNICPFQTEDINITPKETVKLNIIKSFTLNNIMNCFLYSIYNSIHTYKYNKLILLTASKKRFGFFEIKIPSFITKALNLNIILNICIDTKYSTSGNIHVTKNGKLISFDLLNKKYYIDNLSSVPNGSTIENTYTICFSDDVCVINDINVYIIGDIKPEEEKTVTNLEKNDKIEDDTEDQVDGCTVNENEIEFEKKKIEFEKKIVYSNCFESNNKLLITNLKNPTILMNNGLWASIINYNKLFSFRPSVPFFLDTSQNYYIQLNYYVTKGGNLNIIGYNDKNIGNNEITSNITNESGTIIKKLNTLETPFFYYLIYGNTCSDIVLKNLQIYYFMKKEENECCNGGNSNGDDGLGSSTPLDCDPITCNNNGIVVSGSITVT